MELTQLAKDFFTGIGLNNATIISILAEDSEVDIQAEIAGFQTLMKTKLKPTFETEYKEQAKVDFGKSRIKFMRDINKSFDLGLTGDEIKDMDYATFLTEAKTTIDSKSEGTKEEKAAKYQALSDKYEASVQTQKSEYETKLSSSESNLSSYISKNEFLKTWSKKTLGVSETQKEFYQTALLNEATTKYKISEGGTITNLDDTPVMNPEENGIWKSIDDFVNYKVEKLDIAKKSGGSETGKGAGFSGDGTGGSGGGSGQKDNKSAAADAIIERAKAQGIVTK